MNKKEYIKPAVLKVRNVYPTHIICGSGGDYQTILSSGNQDPIQTTTKEVGGIQYYGIWSE